MDRRRVAPIVRSRRRAPVTVVILASALVLALASGWALSGCPRAGAVPRGSAETRRITQERDRLRTEVNTLRREVQTLRAAGGVGQTPVALYFVKSTPSELYLAPEVRRIRQQPDMMAAALRELVRGPAAGSNLGPVLPKNTTVRGVRVEKSVAYADFSPEVTRLNVGSRGEALSVAAIVNTLTKFPEVERVKILVDGKPVETLAGHIDIRQPLARNDTVVYI